MMKKMRIIAVLTMMICMVLASVSAYAAYDHKVNVSAGNGKFESGSDINASGNVSASVDTSSASVTLGGKTTKVTTMPDGKSPDASKYFVTGLKVTGRDNSNRVGNITAENRDLDLVVSYGLKTDMVSYQVQYLDAATGNPIGGLSTETHYGVKGDKPIVSYKYAEGYLPNAYAATKTLSADSSQNVITFWYYAVDNEGRVITVVDGVPAGQAANAAGAGGVAAGTGAGAANAGDGTTTVGDNATPLADGPAEVVDLDDNNTPKADAEDVDEGKTPLSMPVKIAGVVAILAAIAALIAYLVKRNSQYEDDDEEDEDDAEA